MMRQAKKTDKHLKKIHNCLRHVENQYDFKRYSTETPLEFLIRQTERNISDKYNTRSYRAAYKQSTHSIDRSIQTNKERYNIMMDMFIRYYNNLHLYSC
jgi:hypothetical protein